MKIKAIAACMMVLSGSVYAKTLEVSSPDGRLMVKVSDDQAPKYQVLFNGKSVITPSLLGMAFKETGEMSSGFKISASKKQSHDSSWEQPWGERKVVHDNHNELFISFSSDDETANRFNMRFRVFDDGLGFRYEVPKQAGLDQVEITDEFTEFAVADAEQSTAWWIPGRFYNRYEYVHKETPMHDIPLAHTPMTFKQPNGTHVSIHEAALVDYAAMVLDQRRPGTFKANLTPWSDGIKVKTQTDFKTPWRTIQVSDKATGLLNSDLILNLNEPSKIEDTSWIKPGKYVGIWWGMHVNETTWGSGPKHGATTEETIRYMDFAAKYGFDGVLVEGWNEGWDGDWFFNGDVFKFDKPYPDFDIEKIAAHGKKVGVKLIGHHETSGNVTNYRNQMEDAFKLYQKNGVSQIKTGYVADGGNIKRIDENGIVRKEWHDGQFMVNEYMYNIELAAKYKLSINTHEPIKDTGLRRTYPNWISREGARGQEFNAWGNPPNPPSHMPTLAYTRMLSGPMDFTPGIFNMEFEGLGDKTNRPQTTLAKQLATYVVLYSPIQMAADLPRHYEANLPAFQFIRDVPTDWEESKAVAGEVGDYVVFARKDRNSENWFMGGMTDEDARTVTIPLDFLDAGKKYKAEIYRDGEDAEWKYKPYELTIESKNVTNADSLTLPMATSGGFAVAFKVIN